MILVIIKMTARPAKRKEFLQTVQVLTQPIRKLKGCLNCSACQDVENENFFCMIQGWENQKAVNKYLQFDLFEILLGIKNLMSEPWVIRFNTVSSSTGVGTINKARSKTT